MKFPTSHAPFGVPPALSAAQSEQLERTTQLLLANTMRDYEQYEAKTRSGQASPSSEQWKPVKKMENLVCYRQRSASAVRHSSSKTTFPSSESEASFGAAASVSNPLDDEQTTHNATIESWRLPKLLTVGTLAGSLEDAMYGLLAPDATSTFIRASYTHEELLDTELLHCLEAPTLAKPFQSRVIKWHVLGLHKMSWRRDFVMLEATGIVRRGDGQRVGYHIMHSVDLPGLGPLADEHQVFRGRVLSCHLFRQLPHGSVDVYMRGFVDPCGDMHTKVALSTTVGALLKLGHAIECAHSKKLEYLLEQQQHTNANASRGTSGNSRSSAFSDRSSGAKSKKTTKEASPSCGVCSTTLHRFRSVAHCELCSQAVCSHCRVTRRLSYRVARPKEVKRKNTVLCTACVTSAFHHSAEEIACAELAASKLGPSNPQLKHTSSVGENVVSQVRLLTNSVLSNNNTALSSNYSPLETPVEEVEEEEDPEEYLLTCKGPLPSTDSFRRRATTIPPQNDRSLRRLDTEKLSELDLSLSLSVVSYVDESTSEQDEDDASRKKARMSDQPSSAGARDAVHPLTSSMPPKPRARQRVTESQLQQQRELMQRMSELRRNAESVYQMTRRNTESMCSGSMPTLSTHAMGITTADMDMELD